MDQPTTLCIGLDVHKDSIQVAHAEAHRTDPPHFVGALGPRQADLDKLVRRLQRKAARLVGVAEAGPGGDVLHRSWTGKGLAGTVVAPSLIPKRPGDRVPTDRRDAVALARLMRSGALTPVSVPAVEDEAIRDLCRARDATRVTRKAARLRLQPFRLRLGLPDPGRANWTAAHRRSLARGGCPTPAQQLVFQEARHAADNEQLQRLGRRAQALHALTPSWRLAPLVEALQALRGVQGIVALTVGAELGDLPRFQLPRHLAAFVGVLPSAHSSGDARRLGAITKAGNARARRVLVEGAWAYRDPATISAHIQRRIERRPPVAQRLGWKAQVRVCKRFRQFTARGKQANGVVPTLARDLLACRWAIAQEVPLPA